nr:hypothetical protein [Tanacetum cinerariifolium]
MYSAFMIEIAVLFCFIDDQLTNLSPENYALAEDIFAFFPCGECVIDNTFGELLDWSRKIANHIVQRMILCPFAEMFKRWGWMDANLMMILENLILKDWSRKIANHIVQRMILCPFAEMFKRWGWMDANLMMILENLILKFLSGTTIVEVILVKGHLVLSIMKVRPVGFDPLALVKLFIPVEVNKGLLVILEVCESACIGVLLVDSLDLQLDHQRVEIMEQQVLNLVVEMMLVVVKEEHVLGKIGYEQLVVDMIDDERVLHKTIVEEEYGGVMYELATKVKGSRNLSTKYYKDESCWNTDVKSKTTEDIISNKSFMEVLVLNHYVPVKNVL